MTSTTSLHCYFAELGLEQEVADLYLALHTHGPQSLFQLSRNARIERTRVYRLLDTLKDHCLVEEELRYKRKIYKAAALTNLEVLLSKREQQLQELQENMHHMQALLDSATPSTATTRIQFYQGVDGIKQMMWNETKGQTENLSILHENMQGRTNLAFFERWVRKCNQQNIAFRSIIDDHFITTQQQWYNRHRNERLRNWQPRYIPSSVHVIANCTVIYDNVVACYDWRDGDIFGMEIYNDGIALMQRQFFEMLWQLGQPVNDLRPVSSLPQG